MKIRKRVNGILIRLYHAYENYLRRGNWDFLRWFLRDKRYFWLKSTMEVRPVAHLYSDHKNNTLKMVIVLFDGHVYTPGLADMLRSMVSVYYWCKKNDIDFRIKCSYPFELNDYLVPNRYSWRITSNEFDYCNACPRALISYNRIFGETKNKELHRDYLDSFLSCGYRQIHLYTNTYCYDDYFNEEYCELFKPSLRLEKELNCFQEKIGCEYISISFRFTQLLGDLKDSFGKPLSLAERNKLIETCLTCIKPLVESNGVKKALVTSDSVTFLKHIESLPYVYLIPGSVGNIINKVTNEQIDKTFWDMFMISRAKKAYMVRTNQMYRSGFAKRAAMIGNIPFEELVLE